MTWYWTLNLNICMAAHRQWGNRWDISTWIIMFNINELSGEQIESIILVQYNAMYIIILMQWLNVAIHYYAKLTIYKCVYHWMKYTYNWTTTCLHTRCVDKIRIAICFKWVLVLQCHSHSLISSVGYTSVLLLQYIVLGLSI